MSGCCNKRLFFALAFLLLQLISFLHTKPSFCQNTEVLIQNDEFSVDARLAIDSLYNRDVNGARKLLQPWRVNYPQHPIWELWDGMEVWWEVLEDLHDRTHDPEFLNRMQKADYAASRLLNREPGHPDALIIRAVANGFVARLYANREEWVTSLRIGRKAYTSYQELLKVAPDLPDNAFAEGIKLYYSAYLPEAYPVVRAVSWFLPEGDRKKGIETLRMASERGVFAKPEALYFLGMILLNYENEYREAIDVFEQLIQLYPQNHYFKRVYLRTLGRLNRYSDIQNYVDQNLPLEPRNEMGLDLQTQMAASYWRGRAKYHFGNWKQAQVDFEQALKAGNLLESREERDLYLLSAYYAGRSHEIMGNPDIAEEFYRISSDQSLLPNLRDRSARRLEAM